jgi:hypothetical protein
MAGITGPASQGPQHGGRRHKGRIIGIGGDVVTRRADARLEDPQALDEIEIYGELVIAASSSEEPLSQEQIDEALGLDQEPEPPVSRPT